MTNINARVWGIDTPNLSNHVRVKDGQYYFAWNGWHRISLDGVRHRYVDCSALADAVGDYIMNNDIMKATSRAEVGEWEQISGYNPDVYHDYIEEHPDEFPEYRNADDPEAWFAENYGWDYPDVYQWFIVTEEGAELLKYVGDEVYYNEELDVYLWGVTHLGMSWEYIPCGIGFPKDLTA